MKMGFKVGDKVVTLRSRKIGTVVNITPKRKDVVVDFGRYKKNFSEDGREKGTDVWYVQRIELLTPEIVQEMKDDKDIRKCWDTIERKFKRHELTASQARQILQIFGEG